jgi:hypothetical protein
VKGLLWLIELSLLGFNLNSTGWAESLHLSDSNESEDDIHHYELPTKTDDSYVRTKNPIAILANSNGLGRPMSPLEVTRNPSDAARMLIGKVVQREECFGLETDDGPIFTIVGPLGNIKVGDRVKLFGTPVDPMNRTICMQGNLIAVHDISLTE